MRTSVPRFTSRSIVLPLLFGSIALAVAACSSGAAPSWTYPPAADPAAVAPAQPAAVTIGARTAAMGGMSMNQVQHPAAPVIGAQPASQAVSVGLNLTIVTGDMIGHTEFPAFIPADFTLPANSTVTVTITNFDDATALPKGSEQYAVVSGTTDGTATYTPIKATYPNGSSGASRTITSLDPADVSHTLTIPGLGINVPIPAQSRETFTIRTGAAGTYTWHCMDPCGNGPTGWGTAMSMKKGFMEGTITVV